MAAGIMMHMLRIWAPLGLAGIVVIVATAIGLHTPRPAFDLAPLPAPVHVSAQRIAELDAETRMPLFAPSRSNQPIGGDGQAQQSPPPALTGIVAGEGRSLALIKTAKGDTVVAHVGDTIDGWAIVSIAPRAIVVSRGGAQQTIGLVFGKSDGPASMTDARSTTAPVTHPMMASPSFDGLAAIRSRGLPEANIPLGSPLVKLR